MLEGAEELPDRLLANGVPQQFVDQFKPGAPGAAKLDLTGTGDLGQRILATVPAQFQDLVKPLIPGIVQAIHEAFAIAIASTFWVSIGAALLAAVFVLFLKERPMNVAAPMEASASEAA